MATNATPINENNTGNSTNKPANDEATVIVVAPGFFTRHKAKFVTAGKVVGGGVVLGGVACVAVYLNERLNIWHRS